MYEDGVGPLNEHAEPELAFHPAIGRATPAKVAESTAWSTIQSYSQWHWTELTLLPRPPRG
jgi:hypothetical protein